MTQPPADNARRYRFADFTTANYRALVRSARQRYPVRGYAELPLDERFVVWRHDVDISMHRALRLATIEAEEGMRATYFVRFHSHFYNLLEDEVTRRLRSIVDLGHDIGLHFETDFWGVDTVDQLESALSCEARALEAVFGRPVRVFSFHNPAQFSLTCQNWTYAGLINAYARYFRENVGYCSDSNGIWRFRRLADVLERADDERLQVLTHPEHWTEEVTSPRERIERSVHGRAAAVLALNDAKLQQAGRESVDW